MSKKINIVTLGCSKNRVDSEFLSKQFQTGGFVTVHDEENSDADIVIINTCGFIADAKEESIDTILFFSEERKAKKNEKLIVFGCLVERYKKELAKEISNVDAWFGVHEAKDILGFLNNPFFQDKIEERLISTPPHYAYLKISEGCDRTCAFCSIPIIRGKHISKPIESIVKEAEFLLNAGVKEIILIAQDLGYYGHDLYRENRLFQLVDKLSGLDNLEWLRLHYLYPNKQIIDLLPLFKERKNLCKYLDIPVQHISDKMLSKMRRNHTKEDVLRTIDLFRNKIPEIALRTTVLVGHPGETEKDFLELVAFTENTKFDRLGAFTYSHEEDTFCYKNYKDSIPEKTKIERLEIIMDLQQNISESLNINKIGKSLKVLIDRKESDYFVGRTEFDSPEVDNEVIIENSDKLKIGKFYNIKITGAQPFDLEGAVENAIQ
ncbi:MAG: 30S ribosomal protein S12 methylthiotransferase RimO [Bacteroidales bacterium]|nr:30S ribosomal protein S12 methylthiotransferase RimO [Bacteroidales bacterium]